MQHLKAGIDPPALAGRSGDSGKFTTGGEFEAKLSQCDNFKKMQFFAFF
jgi:Flp pilus assembly secretin CpaC